MSFDFLSNNKVYLCGEIVTEPEFSHEIYGEGFFELNLSVPRLSGQVDIVPITISERLLLGNDIKVGAKIALNGQFRSYNKLFEDRNRLMLTVFARELLPFDDSQNPNIIELSGFVCKQPIFRITPFSREICDMLIAVNRAYNKSDYLPCIAWGRNARFISTLPVGEKIYVVGRIQSREYVKKTESGDDETRIAYEISITKVSESIEAKTICSEQV